LSDGRPKRPLDPAAVKAANEKVWAEFPELKGRQLTMSDSDYKYRRAWREAYKGEVDKKTCPKKPVTSGSVVPCSTPPTTTPMSKEEWQKKALAAAGLDIKNWIPSAGFEANRENVKKVYAYYTTLYDQNHNLLWAGMAKLAGGTVYGGLQTGLTIKFAAGALGGPIAVRQAQFVENKLVGMQQDIFMDLAWQHQAYLERGICELDAAYRRGDISKKNFDAWLDIDSGDPERVWRGNKALLYQEQYNILDPTYTEIRGGLLGYPTAKMLSLMTQSPIPGGKPFTEVVPGGDVTKFQDRWQWIETDMLPAYQQLSPDYRTTLINEPLEDLAARKFAAPPK
jgi:hypothetical protein